MQRFIVEIEVNTTGRNLREEIKDEIESLGLTVLSVKPVNPNDNLTTVYYSAEGIRQHLENTVESDDERMKLLHLVTDEQLEDIAVKEVIENDYCLDHIHQNMVSILRSATENLKKRETFEAEKNLFIDRLLFYWDAPQKAEGSMDNLRLSIQDLFSHSTSPTPEQIASRTMVALRDLTVVTRESVESLLDWAAMDLNKGWK